jgi:hypothetical protein
MSGAATGGAAIDGAVRGGGATGGALTAHPPIVSGKLRIMTGWQRMLLPLYRVRTFLQGKNLRDSEMVWSISDPQLA